ncbi:MAG: dodecin family protein [Actinomycetota bacterium]|nr:dodecin family protein [Actinomycetota bacterium]
MANTYSVTEIVGTSPDGVDAAIRSGIEDASKTLKNLDWAQVTDVRLHLDDGAVQHFQVSMKLGFRVER